MSLKAASPSVNADPLQHLLKMEVKEPNLYSISKEFPKMFVAQIGEDGFISDINHLEDLENVDNNKIIYTYTHTHTHTHTHIYTV